MPQVWLPRRSLMTLRPSPMGLAASRAAGLQLETHRCRGLLADPLPEVLRQALDRLTLGISQCEDGRISITGLPLVLLVALARSLGQEAWTRTVTEFVGLCRCKVKTAIVPSRNLQGWKLRLAHTPFGTEALSGIGSTSVLSWARRV